MQTVRGEPANVRCCGALHQENAGGYCEGCPDVPNERDQMNAQEKLWMSSFGDEYQRRSPGNVEANRVLFEHALDGLTIHSAIEFGAGVGSNLVALRELLPNAHLSAVEINPVAVAEIRKKEPGVQVHVTSIIGWTTPRDLEPIEPPAWDLALTKGLLIHIAPVDLLSAYKAIHRATKRYVLLCEYYCPKPRMIPYRGNDDVLWARDFAGEMIDHFPDLRLVDYGWVYHRDPHPQDDLTWFLMEKRA